MLKWLFFALLCVTSVNKVKGNKDKGKNSKVKGRNYFLIFFHLTFNLDLIANSKDNIREKMRNNIFYFYFLLSFIFGLLPFLLTITCGYGEVN